MFPRKCDRVPTVDGLGNDIKIMLTRQEPAQAITENGMIVGN
jgi:hypothetical protein